MVSQKPKYCKNFERNSHWRKLSMIMMWERYCNASPKPEFFLFSLFIFLFISQLIWIRLGWNFHRWFSIQKQVNWCTIDPFSLKCCTSQHSYPVPLTLKRLGGGGPKRPPPSTFRAITLQRTKLSPRHFMTFFFQVSRTFWHQICDARGYGSEVT